MRLQAMRFVLACGGWGLGKGLPEVVTFRDSFPYFGSVVVGDFWRIESCRFDGEVVLSCNS